MPGRCVEWLLAGGMGNGAVVLWVVPRAGCWVPVLRLVCCRWRRCRRGWGCRVRVLTCWM